MNLMELSKYDQINKVKHVHMVPHFTQRIGTKLVGTDHKFWRKRMPLSINLPKSTTYVAFKSMKSQSDIYLE